MIFGFLSKFWILQNLFREKIFFLEMKNIFRKSIFWKIFDFSKKNPENIFSALFRKLFFISRRIIFFGTQNFKSKICSGIQKSYLENRTIIIKSFKLKNPIILTQIEIIPYTAVHCYVHRPLSRTFDLSESHEKSLKLFDLSECST